MNSEACMSVLIKALATFPDGIFHISKCFEAINGMKNVN